MRIDFLAAGDGALLLLIAKATLILVVAGCLALLMKRASAGMRHLVWVGTLAALLLVPAVSSIAPLKFPVLPPAPAAAAKFVAAPSGNDDVPQRSLDAGAPSLKAPAAAAPLIESTESSDAGWLDTVLAPEGIELLALAWMLVALAILAVLAHGAYTVRQIIRRASPLQDQAWLDTLYEIADRLDLADAPRLVKSEDVRMPFACGCRSATIVLPAECEGWSVERRHAVLLHELAHVQRRDLVWHTVGRLACAIYWFHPLAWSAARRLRAESERACDDVALALGVRPTDYAEHLLDIVSSVKGERTPVTALAMARRREFEGRMLAILDPDIARTRPGRLQSLALAMPIATAVVLIGAAAPVARVETTTAPADASVAVTRAAADASAEAGATADASDEARAVADANAEGRAVADVGDEARHAGSPAMAGGEMKSSKPGMAIASSDDERPVLLARVLAKDTSANLRRIAAWGLAEHADAPVAANALATALRRDADASVREMAAWALAESDGRGGETAALMQALRSDRDARVRATAAWTLGSIEARDAAPALLGALRDTDSSVRSRAIWALGNLELDRAPAELLEQLTSADRRIRMLTAWALYEIEDPAATPALSAALRAERDTELQLAYLRALASVGEESVDAIHELLDSPDPRVKRVAVQALAGGDAAGPWPWPWPDPRPYP